MVGPLVNSKLLGLFTDTDVDQLSVVPDALVLEAPLATVEVTV